MANVHFLKDQLQVGIVLVVAVTLLSGVQDPQQGVKEETK